MLNEMKNTKPLNKTNLIKEVLSWFFLIVMAICFCVALYKVYLMRTTGEQAFMFGYRPAVVMSGSMEPYMDTHSLCFNKKLTSPEDVEIGDVITYQIETDEGKTILVTHRVIAIENGLYYFKGDNNRVEDGYGLPYENLVSEVVFVWNGGVVFVDAALWLGDVWESGVNGKVICISVGIGIVCAYHLLRMLCGYLWQLCCGKSEKDASDPDPDLEDTREHLTEKSREVEKDTSREECS